MRRWWRRFRYGRRRRPRGRGRYAAPAWTGRPERIADGDTVLLPGQVPWRDLVHPGDDRPGGDHHGTHRSALDEPTQLLPRLPLLTPGGAWRSGGWRRR